MRKMEEGEANLTFYDGQNKQNRCCNVMKTLSTLTPLCDSETKTVLENDKMPRM